MGTENRRGSRIQDVPVPRSHRGCMIWCSKVKTQLQCLMQQINLPIVTMTPCIGCFDLSCHVRSCRIRLHLCAADTIPVMFPLVQSYIANQSESVAIITLTGQLGMIFACHRGIIIINATVSEGLMPQLQCPSDRLMVYLKAILRQPSKVVSSGNHFLLKNDIIYGVLNSKMSQILIYALQWIP